MSLPEFLILSLVLWAGLALLVAAIWAFAATRLKRDHTERITDPSYPPPPPAPVYPSLDAWSDFDDVAFAWFLEGQANR